MSKPGALRPDELSPAGNDQLWNPVAAWFSKTDDALLASFGFRMRILTPYGGYRTSAEQSQVNPSLAASSSDHCKGRAIDIDNQRDFRKMNEHGFEQVMAAHGWVFTARNPNPDKDEPWHAVNYNTLAPAGGAGTPIDETTNEKKQEDEMELAGNGFCFIKHPGGTVAKVFDIITPDGRLLAVRKNNTDAENVGYAARGYNIDVPVSAERFDAVPHWNEV